MRINEKTAISTNKVLLVPYEASHVLKYHGWMEDPEIQEATASEPMSLEMEYANQREWRDSHDKLTFILCAAPGSEDGEDAVADLVELGKHDAEERMIGDVNFFFYEEEDEGDEAEEDELGVAEEVRQRRRAERWRRVKGEIDIMVAERAWRSKGIGEAAVRAILTYARNHMDEMLEAYTRGEAAAGSPFAGIEMLRLMVKVKESNVASRALFKKLGFTQVGEVNYFGEVTMVLDWRTLEGTAEGGLWSAESEAGLGYRELPYEKAEAAKGASE